MSVFRMAAVLSPEEEQATREFIDGANYLRQQWGAGPIPWNLAVRFLMARKFEVKRALDLYQAHENIRSQEGLLNIDPRKEPLRKELSSGKFSILPSRDSNGAAIAVFQACQHHPNQVAHRTVLQCVVYQLDVALDNSETQRNGLVFIYDMTNSKYNNFDYELSQKILTMLKGGYPARLKKVLIVSAPLWFRAPFNILRMFLRQKLRDRVYTTNMPQLRQHIPDESLPQSLGGQLAVDHGQWVHYCMVNVDNYLKSDYCDISSFLDNKFNQLASLNANSDKEVSVTSSNASVDFASDASGDVLIGVTEKHQSETAEKEIAKTTHNGPESMSISYGNHSNDSAIDAGTPISDQDSLVNSLHLGEEGVSVEKFVEFVRRKGRKGLFHDYSVIRSTDPDGSFEASRARYNLHKNRYTDVLCYDHSRVKLSSKDDDPSSDYINANYVDGYKQPNAFISTQGPLPKTFADFWRMVWEEQVLVIVMTTRTVERGRVKCGQYWPKDVEGAEQYGDLIIINVSCQEHRDYTFTTLSIQNTQTEESREVTHCQFTSWPDYGVPHSAAAMLDFLFRVREIQASRMQSLGTKWKGHELGPPILVHCSAGIGRTGTFCTLDISLAQLADVGTVNVECTVQRIRSQRAYSIQMPDQYVFCHLAVIEYALNEGLLDDVDLTGFDDSDDDSD